MEDGRDPKAGTLLNGRVRSAVHGPLHLIKLRLVQPVILPTEVE